MPANTGLTVYWKNNAPIYNTGEAFVPVMPYGRGMGMAHQPSGAVGIGRGMAGGAVGRGNVAPPPGFCVPKVGTNNPPGMD